MNSNKAIHLLTEVWFAGEKPSQIAARLRQLANELEKKVEDGDVQNAPAKERTKKSK